MNRKDLLNNIMLSDGICTLDNYMIILFLILLIHYDDYKRYSEKYIFRTKNFRI